MICRAETSRYLPTAAEERTPPGWTYNPSAFRERVYIVMLALIGSAISSYLALFQYKIMDNVWEPFFGEGSRKILTSPTSFILPVSDAALGAVAYLIDAVTGIVGGRGRWQTMPWMVVIFGIFVGPLSAISIALVVAQPVLYGSWCSLCLLSAVIAVVMVGPAMDEVLASIQYLRRVKAGGGDVGAAFWGRRVVPQQYSVKSKTPENKWRVWPIWICMALSAALIIMAEDEFPRAAHAFYLFGPIIFSGSCIALWETTRFLRYGNILWMAAIVSFGGMTPGVLSVLAALAVFSVWPIPYYQKFAGGWRRY